MIKALVRGRVLLVPAVLVALAGGAFAAAPASAADVCAYSGDTPAALPAAAFDVKTVVLGVSATKVTGNLAVPEECQAALLGWRVDWGHGVVFTGEKPTVTLAPKTLTPGPATGTLTVAWSDSAATTAEDVTTFGTSLLRRTTFGNSFNAVGEPLRSGGPLYLKATLGVADWNTGRYVPYRGRSVRVQWKALGEAYVSYDYEKTDSKGRIKAYWTANASGTWRLQYGGNSLAAGTISNADYVQVVAR